MFLKSFDTFSQLLYAPGICPGGLPSTVPSSGNFFLAVFWFLSPIQRLWDWRETVQSTSKNDWVRRKSSCSGFRFRRGKRAFAFRDRDNGQLVLALKDSWLPVASATSLYDKMGKAVKEVTDYEVILENLQGLHIRRRIQESKSEGRQLARDWVYGWEGSRIIN